MKTLRADRNFVLQDDDGETHLHINVGDIVAIVRKDDREDRDKTEKARRIRGLRDDLLKTLKKRQGNSVTVIGAAGPVMIDCLERLDDLESAMIGHVQNLDESHKENDRLRAEIASLRKETK